MGALRLRFTRGHALWVAALAPLCILLFIRTRYAWAGPALVAVAALVTLVTFRGRRLTGWVAAVIAWLVRRRRLPDVPSEPVVGATVRPGDHVAVRWQGEFLVAVIELIPRPFTPTVVVGGQAHTDDVVDTRLLEQLLSVNCPDLEADIVSAGYRVGNSASPDVVSLYEQVIGSDPAPAHRQSWIVLRADPARAGRSARRRDVGVAGLARYLVASATRIADQLAAHGIDAVCGRSFDDYDHATEISFEREKWSKIKGHGNFTAAYIAPGGPDVWWSVPADHTITRVRVVPGMAPQSTVLLTTQAKPKRPRGFSRVSGGQRAALEGQHLIPDRHHQLPIGSAGVLVGETASSCPVYMPFDDVDASINLGDARTFMQFAVRASAAGGIVTLGPRFRQFAELIGAHIGPEAKVTWPKATTYLGRHPGLTRVILRHNVISTPRHHQLPIRPVTLPEETRYQNALPR
ncbi:type VII secretion protein EccE [Mycobacterium parmense]|uniref:Type VII secretion protein EccE n=1 Tax=Mycobacterium parmense TaxID=185642 RepID=A0A7I7Z188_9MYCO|nr:type VII secretion protein EccE [Mycobacterium parmense]MCV7352733.1 type VII secretion protein EccE [Mycobacterium parmense]ORW54644.1 type VII secretion protein EccE [Mycobacterium parmense]BBZ46741.1 type VII secretion protein EccE [Mycobacterium parmense]